MEKHKTTVIVSNRGIFLYIESNTETAWIWDYSFLLTPSGRYNRILSDPCNHRSVKCFRYKRLLSDKRNPEHYVICFTSVSKKSDKNKEVNTYFNLKKAYSS